MMGLIPPSNGQVLLGQTNLAVQPHALRQRMGCVLQEDGLFSGSLAENVARFESVEVHRLEEVLRRVGLWAVVQRSPMGVAARLGDLNTGLSSGELQRLMLARALYANPDYLFLDEGTANLDPHSCEQIFAVIKQLSCTRVLVTHDLRFAALADRVLMLQEGRLVDSSAQFKSAAAPSAG